MRNTPKLQRAGSRVLIGWLCVAPVVASAQSGQEIPGSPRHRARLAVTGFTNDQTVEPRDAWLATAIEEALASRLARVPELIVVPPPRLHQAYRELREGAEEPPTPAALARALGAEVLITGRCGGHADAVSVELRVEMLSGSAATPVTQHIKGAKLLEAVERVQDAALTALGVSELAAAVRQRINSAGPRSPSALEYHARALQAARAEQSEQAYRYARRALEYDEQYRPALATLAQLEVQAGPAAHPLAARHLRTLSELARAANDPIDWAAAELGQGVILHLSGAFDPAYLRYESALALSWQHELPYGQLSALNSIVELCLTRTIPPHVQPSTEQTDRYQRQNLLEAAAWQQVALELTADLHDFVGQMTGYMRLALIYERLGRTEPALASYRQALAAAEQLSSRHNQAVAWLHIGQCLGQQQKFAEAIEATRHCIDIAPAELSAAARLALAGIHQRADQPEQALAEMEHAWTLLRATSDLQSQLRCARDVAVLRRQLGRHQAAIEALKEAIDIAHALKAPEEASLQSQLEAWQQDADR